MYRRSALLTFLIALLQASSMASTQSFSLTQLSQEGQAAYQTLLAAKQFEADAIGYAAQPSNLVAAYRSLLKEAPADGAFKALLDRATPAGQLYALCGIYWTDRAFFLSVVDKHRSRSDYVKTQFGCIGGRQPASGIIRGIENGSYPDAFSKSNKSVYPAHNNH